MSEPVVLAQAGVGPVLAAAATTMATETTASRQQEEEVEPRDQPSAPAREQPSAPAREQPSGPAREQPSAPARDQPSAPTVGGGADGRGRASPQKARGGGGSDGGQQRRPQQQQQHTPGSDGEVPSAPGKKKHRRRPSKKKRRWKPYFKLTWEEKKKLDERESVRAAKTRAEMFAKGFTVAPYNTTQFLMDEHDREEPDLNPGFCPSAVTAANHRRSAGKVDADSSGEDDELLLEEEEEESGSDGMGGSGSEFLQRDFCETYERYHAETLQNMSKQELIREYLELEKCLSRLEDENNRLRRRLDGKKQAARGPDGAGGPRASELELERELEKLRVENQRLLKENEQCKQERKLPQE